MLSTLQQAVSKAMEYIDLEENEPTKNESIENEPIENPKISLRGSSKSSPRLSPLPWSSPLRSPVHSLGVDPVQ